MGDRSWFPDLRPSGLEQQYKEGRKPKIEGILLEKKESKDGWRLCLGDLAYKGSRRSREKILIYLSKDHAGIVPGLGQRLTVSGEISFYQEAPNPGNFNQKFYYQKRRIHACLKNGYIERTEGATDVVREKLWQMGCVWREQMLKNVGERQGQILSAMMLGEKKDTEELAERYQRAGIGHLLAISGLHVSFLGMGLYRMLRRCGIPRPMGAMIGIVCLGAYVEMCGSGVSARRAFIMFVVSMGAEITGRAYDQITSLSLAAIVILAEQPLWLFDAGFLLSFGAMIGFSVVYPALEQGEKGKKLLLATALQMVTYPVMLSTFYECAPWSMLWNLLVIPLAPIVFVSGLSGGILGAMSSRAVVQYAAKILSVPAFGILSFYEAGSRVCLALPFSRIITGRPDEWKLVVYAVTLLILVSVCLKEKEALEGQGKTKWKYVAAGGYLVAAVLLMVPERQKGLEITMLDVGQGECSVLQTESGRTYMVDGGSTSVSSVGKYRMESWIKYRGIRRIDLVFVSHGDEDHMAGIKEMLERKDVGVPIRCVVLPKKEVWDEKIRDLAKTAQKVGTKVLVMEQGKQIQDQKLRVECLAPGDDRTEAGNEASMVLDVRYGTFEMLFTGDVEKEGEAALTKTIERKQETGGFPSCITVLKCAHHGSRNGSTKTFLRQVRPKAAVISAGKGNRYGHPHQETLERLQTIGCRVYDTKEDGTITIWTDGKTCKIKE